MTALTVRCLTNLATPQELFGPQRNTKGRIEFLRFFVANLAAATRVELVPSRLQDERSETN
jgi:hypothetical protein